MDIWSILQPFDIFYGHLVYFVVIWYIFPMLIYCSEKNLATLINTYLDTSIEVTAFFERSPTIEYADMSTPTPQKAALKYSCSTAKMPPPLCCVGIVCCTHMYTKITLCTLLLSSYIQRYTITILKLCRANAYNCLCFHFFILQFHVDVA
jgi:hypothetical protein